MEELYKMTYQTMLQQEYKEQFTHLVPEVNLAQPHEYWAMVMACLNGKIGEHDYMMLVDSGSELNIMTLLQLVPPDTRRGAKGARLGPAARLGPQPLGVRLTHRYIHGGIDDEILAKGRKFP